MEFLVYLGVIIFSLAVGLPTIYYLCLTAEQDYPVET
jgi:hypothetical protein